MFSLLNPTNPAVGVDLSTAQVKIIELDKSGSRTRVVAQNSESIPEGLVTESKIENPEEVGQVLRRTLRTSGSRQKTLSMCVPSALTVSRTIQVSKNINRKELEERVVSEIDQHVPSPIETISYDWQILGPNPVNDEMNDVTILATKTEDVDTYIRVADVADCRIKVLGSSAYVVEYAFSLFASLLPDFGVNKVVAVFDIGANVTALNVLIDGKSIYSREQNFGGTELTNNIRHRYGLSPEDAARVKREGGLPDSYETEVLLPFKEEIFKQIGRLLQLFYSAQSIEQIDCIALAGGCANIPYLDDFVQSRLQTQTIVCSPFANMQMSSRVSKAGIEQEGPSLLRACGLALRGLER